MRLITRDQKAAEAAESWKKQYCVGERWREVLQGDTEEVYSRLLKLGPTPRPNDVDAVIGNSSWTRIICNECRQHDVSSAVQIGEEPDIESNTALICPDCISKAAGLCEGRQRQNRAAGIARDNGLCGQGDG